MLIAQFQFQIIIVFGISTKLGKQVRSNDKVLLIRPIRTLRYKKIRTCGVQLFSHLYYYGVYQDESENLEHY